MVLELNEVLLEGEPQTLSMMAEEGRTTCLTGGTREQRTRWLLAMMGFVTVKNGYISIDGEPLTPASAADFRRLMAYAPARLEDAGEVKTYEAPTVQDIFTLRANRELPISNGILGEEMRRIAPGSDDQRVRILAVAALLNKPVVLVDDPPAEAAEYLCRLAQKGRIVIVATHDERLLAVADRVTDIAG